VLLSAETTSISAGIANNTIKIARTADISFFEVFIIVLLTVLLI
jgi:hypothetical protein